MSVISRSRMLSLRRSLRSADTSRISHKDVERSYDNARLLVKFFYICSVYLTATLLDLNDKDLGQVTQWDLLWPLAWIDVGNIEFQMKVIGAVAFVMSMLAVIFSGSVVVRVLFSLSFLMSATLSNSYAGINHSYHAWFWVTFVLIFLPSGECWRSELTRRSHMMSYLTVFLAAQVLLFLFYTLSGTWKIMYGLSAMAQGLDGIFSFQGLSYNLANRVVQTNTNPLLAKFAIDNYMIAWVGAMSVMYIQFTAIIAAFRPRLQALWGLLIAIFHFGTWLLMGIVFAQHILLLLIFFIMSPFRPVQFDLRKTIMDLPLVGIIFGRLVNGSSSSQALADVR